MLKRLWLCLPPVVLCGFDGCITLWGQPAAYWEHGFTTVREGNPLAAWLLGIHPLAFAAAGIPYVLLVTGVICILPLRWSAVIAALIALAHGVAVLVWTEILFREGPGAWVLLVPASELVLAALWWWAGGRCLHSRYISGDQPDVGTPGEVFGHGESIR
jgi:hypothetical protein